MQRPHVPLFFGGASGPAVPVGAKHADVYMLWGEPVSGIKERIAEVREAAKPHGRDPGFSISFRPILAATEEKAWERAHDTLDRIIAARGGKPAQGNSRPQSVGSQRLLDFAARGDVLDKRLFTPIAAATGAAGNTTALVGTPEQVAESLLSYYDAGVHTILIRGFEPLPDAVDYGRELIPTVRAEVARRERQAAAV
jgi:alkanesulfonate monooxygenase